MSEKVDEWVEYVTLSSTVSSSTSLVGKLEMGAKEHVD